MNKKLAIVLAAIFVSVFHLVTISEAQTMKTEGLNVRRQKIVLISAFTARGDLKDLDAALNEGLEHL